MREKQKLGSYSTLDTQHAAFHIPLMDKEQVAEILVNVATLLDLMGENPFKSRAYVNAARALEEMSEPLDKVIAEERLDQVNGIGESIQKKICELITTGKLAYYEELSAATPPGLVAMLDIPGVGPKKIKVLHDELGIVTVEQLEQACKEGKVAKLKGFGEKTQTNICEGINRRRAYSSRHLISDAMPLAESLLGALRSHPDVIRCSSAGSLRRHREIIGDIDLLASSKTPAKVLDFFAQQSGILNVIAKGETKASVLLEGGIQSDLRVVSDAEFPFALMYFTGSKEHNIVMRRRAIERGLRRNEYGLFRSKEETRDPKLLVPCRTEDEIFEKLGLHYVPPEMREDLGEFALAEGKLDFPDDLQAELGVVVASAHQRLALDEAQNTARIIRAVENRYVHILGHVTGRLLLEREPQKVDVRAVIDACAATGTWIE